MAMFVLRSIDTAFWEKVKARAHAENRPLDKLALRLFSLYVEKGLPALEAAPGKTD